MIKQDYLYVPNLFRICRTKAENFFIVTAKNVSGNYVDASYIKCISGYWVKDTGKGLEDLIEREATGAVKEYQNTWFEGIKILEKKICYKSDFGVKLQHPLGFNFSISLNNFDDLIFHQNIDIIRKIFQCKFKFAVDNSLNQIILLSDKCSRDIRTEDNVSQLKKSITPIKFSDLKVGTVYDYYDSTDPNEDSYERIVYLGKIDNASYLMKGIFWINLPRNLSYHVFLNLNYTESFTPVPLEDLIMGINPQQFICLNKSSRKIRNISQNQRLQLKYEKDKYYNIIDLNELISACKSKIERCLNDARKK